MLTTNFPSHSKDIYLKKVHKYHWFHPQNWDHPQPYIFTFTRVETFLNQSVCFFLQCDHFNQPFYDHIRKCTVEKSLSSLSHFHKSGKLSKSACLLFFSSPTNKIYFCSVSVSLLSCSWWVCWFQPETELKIKEDKSLLKMHFKPQGSCAVDELQKLTLFGK